MFKHLVPAAVVSAMIASAAPVHAQNGNAERAAHREIAARDYATAERRLVAERRIYPNRPALMLNLAAVYMKTGRAEQARALYAQVLERPATEMDMSSGAMASSHAVANTGLAALERTTAFASR